MSYIVQWIIVAAIVATAIVFLVKRLKPSNKDGVCKGCPYSQKCGNSRKPYQD